MNEKVRRVLCLWSISCLRASVFNPSSCYKIFSLIVFGLCPFSFDIVSCMLCWVEPTLLFKQKIIEAEKGFKQKKLRNAFGLTLVSSYYGIQYCWKCLKETLQKKKKPRLTINCWGESICSLVNPLVDSHPPIHSDMVKTPVNKCRFSLPTSG